MDAAESIIILLGLAIQAAIAVACYNIAKSKGKDSAIWGLLGFVISIVALVILMVSDDETTQLKKCPECAELVQLEARVCRHCSYKFAEDGSDVSHNTHHSISIETKKYIISLILKTLQETNIMIPISFYQQ